MSVEHGTLPLRAATASPRFQYRVWDELHEPTARLHRLAHQPRIEHRRDTYLLGTDPKHNLKLRGQRLEINELVQVAAGFEQWHRIGLHPLPSTTGEVHHWLHEFAESTTPLLAEYPADSRVGRRRLLETATSYGLRLVAVIKRRERFVIGSLRAETTAMWLTEAGIALNCVAIEGKDLPALSALRVQLGIEGRQNKAVPLALHQVLERDPA